MKDEFEQAIGWLTRDSTKLSEEDKQTLTAVLLKLRDIVESRQVSSRLQKISKYLQKTLANSDIFASSKPEMVLLDIAKEHPGWIRSLSRADLKRVQTYFWKALSDSAETWDERELANLLAYSLRRKARFEFHPNTNPRTVAATYQKFFSSLPVSEREEIFEELLPRILNEPDFRRHLKNKAKSL